MNTVAFPKLGLEFTMDKVAFDIFGIDITWYAVIIACGFLLAVIYCMSRMKEFGLDSDRAMDAVLVGLIGGLIGARAYYVIFSWDQYKDDLMSIFNTRLGGLAIYGGVIGALLFGGITCKIRKVRLRPMFDITVLGFLIGQCIGRWGNFVNVEAYGSHTDTLFGMTASTIVDGPVHPCFLYESVWCLIGFILLHLYSKRRKFDGEILLMYFMWYGLGRAFIEGLRTDSLYWGPFRVSQMLSVLLVIVSFFIWITVRSRIKRNNDPGYLPLYVTTEESKELLRLAEEKSNKSKSKKAKEEKMVEESMEEGVKTPSDEEIRSMAQETEEDPQPEPAQDITPETEAEAQTQTPETEEAQQPAEPSPSSEPEEEENKDQA